MVQELALSFFFVSIILSMVYFYFQEQIIFGLSLVQKITIPASVSTVKTLILDQKKQRLEQYPVYGTTYASLKIPSINLELPVYYGDTPEILRYGVGHYAGSYFPGEASSIIYAAHNDKRFFMRIPEIPINENIFIETSYGTFQYQVTNKKIILETDLDSLPIQTEEELLMLYTCYPVNSLGHKTERYVVYAKKVEENNENNP